MNKVNNNFNLFELHRTVEALSPEDSWDTLNRLFDTLGALQMQQLSIFEERSLQEIERTLVTLCRLKEDAWVKQQISEISQQARALTEGGTAISPEAVEELKKILNAFLADYRPSVEDRRALAEVTRMLGESLMPPCNEELEEGHFEEIFDVAYALYEGKRSEAERGFHQLPCSHQRRIRAHVSFLDGVLFEDYWASLKALFATVNDLVGNGESYPSKDLIEDMFVELKAINGAQAASIR